jgi:hypothetical protein
MRITREAASMSVLLMVLAAATLRGRGPALRALAVGVATVVGLGLVDQVTRLPSRVSGPVVVTGVVASALVAARSTTSRRTSPTSAGRGLAAVASLVAVMIALTTVSGLVDRAGTVRDGREVVLEDVAVIDGVVRDGEVVGTWLVDLDRAHDPLALRPREVVPFPTVDLASWPMALPRTRARHAELGLEDWVDAVARRDDVLLYAGPRKVELLRVLLAERRGWRCPEPDGVIELPSGDVLVRRFVGAETCGR